MLQLRERFKTGEQRSSPNVYAETEKRPMSTLLVVILIIILLGGVGVAPSWGWHSWGWGPSGLLGVVLVVVLILAILGRI